MFLYLRNPKNCTDDEYGPLVFSFLEDFSIACLVYPADGYRLIVSGEDMLFKFGVGNINSSLFEHYTIDLSQLYNDYYYEILKGNYDDDELAVYAILQEKDIKNYYINLECNEIITYSIYNRLLMSNVKNYTLWDVGELNSKKLVKEEIKIVLGNLSKLLNTFYGIGE